jgi:DNA-directed RNA polymerase subunit RPC12/RpoP
MSETTTITPGNWGDSQTCGCWPSKGIVCMSHAGYVTPPLRQEHVAVRCPVCEGRRLVPNGFYGAVGVQFWSSNSTMPEQCRACSGSGIVWKP